MHKTRYWQWVLAILLILVKAAQYHTRETENDKVLWTDPGDPSSFDFQYGVGGEARQPSPPFRFVEEDVTGTSHKVMVTDANGERWNVKWGHEVQPSIFCTRLVWACGYIVEPEYFIKQGRIEGVTRLKRAGSHLSPDGSFANARFQLRSGVPKFLNHKSWAWTSNPFVGTRQLQGLKILMLLVSNWDAKDARDMAHAPKKYFGMDTNLAIFEDDSAGVPRYLYADDDWGASMGKWGKWLNVGNTLAWTKWDCKGFTAQTADFLKAENGSLRWGFNGVHDKDLTDVTVPDLQWILQYLGRITDEQIRVGLAASGATPRDTECFSVALRQRIEKLQQIAGGTPTARN